jgi:hypothetical protein
MRSRVRRPPDYNFNYVAMFAWRRVEDTQIGTGRCVRSRCRFVPCHEGYRFDRHGWCGPNDTASSLDPCLFVVINFLPFSNNLIKNGSKNNFD